MAEEVDDEIQNYPCVHLNDNNIVTYISDFRLSRQTILDPNMKIVELNGLSWYSQTLGTQRGNQRSNFFVFDPKQNNEYKFVREVDIKKYKSHRLYPLIKMLEDGLPHQVCLFRDPNNDNKLHLVACRDVKKGTVITLQTGVLYTARGHKAMMSANGVPYSTNVNDENPGEAVISIDILKSLIPKNLYDQFPFDEDLVVCPL